MKASQLLEVTRYTRMAPKDERVQTQTKQRFQSVDRTQYRVSVFTARRLSWYYICASVETLVNSLTEQAKVKLASKAKDESNLTSCIVQRTQQILCKRCFSEHPDARRWSPALAEITEAHSNTYDRLHPKQMVCVWQWSKAVGFEPCSHVHADRRIRFFILLWRRRN